MPRALTGGGAIEQKPGGERGGEKMKYNGYTNWETWHVCLLADNEQEPHARAMAMGKRCNEFRRGKGRGTGEKPFDEIRAAAAFHRLLAPMARETREYARANGYLPIEIDWADVARHFMDFAEENENYKAALA